MESLEIAALQQAYQDNIKDLFKNLVTSVTTDHAPVESLAKFKAGLAIAKRALDLASGELAPSLPIAAKARKPKATKTVKATGSRKPK